jgi:O-methyltransferase involved in polyketide biosynthesis
MSEVNVQDTAFWMASCRASDESLSQDPLAKYWVTSQGHELYELYLQEVSPSENLMMCLRNRFFLDRMRSFFDRHPDGILVNVGAGVTSYPYLLNRGHLCVEVDCAPVVSFKSQKMAELRKQGLVPERQVEFIDCDLDDGDQLLRLKTRLEKLVDRPSFILIEGVIYYLKDKSVRDLLAICAGIQRTGDQLGIVSWKPDFIDGSFYKNFSKFLSQRLGQENGDYTFFDNSFFHNLPQYNLLEYVDNPQLLKKFKPGVNIESVGSYADEQLFVLERLAVK